MAFVIDDHPMYLLTPKAALKAFALASDREYYAIPVLVEPMLYDVKTRRVEIVHDPITGRTFPVNPAHVVPKYKLTNAQRSAALKAFLARSEAA